MKVKNFITLQYFPLYGPDYEFGISAGNRPDHNTSQYLEAIITKIKGISHVVYLSTFIEMNAK